MESQLGFTQCRRCSELRRRNEDRHRARLKFGRSTCEFAGSAKGDCRSYRCQRSILVSRVYESEAVGCEPGAGKFLNAVLEIEYGGDPTDLLQEVIRIEESLGRDRNHPRNVSRKIDIDLLYADGLNVGNERLQLPHPRLHLRKFVLQPVADVQPSLILPNQTKTVGELLAQIEDSTKVI